MVKKQMFKERTHSTKNVINDQERSRIEQVLDQHGVMFEHLIDKIDALAEGFSMLSDKIDRIEKRLEKVEVRMERVEDEIRLIRFELQQKVSVEDYRALEQRVHALERKIGVK